MFINSRFEGHRSALQLPVDCTIRRRPALSPPHPRQLREAIQKANHYTAPEPAETSRPAEAESEQVPAAADSPSTARLRGAAVTRV